MPEEFIEEKSPEEIKKSKEKVRKEREFELEQLKTIEELSEQKQKQIKKSKILDWIILGIVAISILALALFVLYF